MKPSSKVINTTRHPCASTHAKTRRCNAPKHLNSARGAFLHHQLIVHLTLVRQKQKSNRTTQYRFLHTASVPTQELPPVDKCKAREISTSLPSRQIRAKTFRNPSDGRVSLTMCSNHGPNRPQLLCNFMQLLEDWRSPRYHKVYKIKMVRGRSKTRIYAEPRMICIQDMAVQTMILQYTYLTKTVEVSLNAILPVLERTHLTRLHLFIEPHCLLPLRFNPSTTALRYLSILPRAKHVDQRHYRMLATSQDVRPPLKHLQPRNEHETFRDQHGHR